MGQQKGSIAYCFSGSYVQIAYYYPQMDEPQLLTEGVALHDGRIPLAVCRLFDDDEWEIGTAAIEFGKKQLGHMMPDLTAVYEQGAAVRIDELLYTPQELMGFFVKKSLDMVKQFFPENTQLHVSCTFPEVDGLLVRNCKAVLESVLTDEGSYYIQDYQESLYDFVMFQKRELRSNEVLYLEAKEGQLYAWTFRSDKTAYGQAYVLEKEDFPTFCFEIKDDALDARLAALMDRFIGKRLVTSVFLSGADFSGGWLKQTLKVLCRGRRVFGVENVTVKGACYRPFRRLDGRGDRREYYLGAHQIRKNIGMYLIGANGAEYCRMLTAGTNWYEAKEQAVLLLDDCDKLTFLVDDVEEEKRNKKSVISLEEFPKRPNLATKIRLVLQFENETDCVVTVTDLGLGELYPASHKMIVEKI